MKSRTAQVATAAVIAIALLGVALWPSKSDPLQMSPFTLLSHASAAERSLFAGADGIAHIASEIVLYPTPPVDPGDRLADLAADATLENNLAFVKQWLSQCWLPVYALGPDGQTHEHKLDFTETTDKPVTVSDRLWYEQDTSRFARVLTTGGQILFANAYDGATVYTALRDRDGILQIDHEPVAEGFRVPDNPADFMGIAAGVTGSVPEKHYPPIQDVTTETLADGSAVRVYRLGFRDPWGQADTCFLFKIKADPDVVTDIECIVEGKVTRTHRRLLAETVEAPGLAWDLSDLAGLAQTQGDVNLHAEKAGSTVTVAQMAQRATSTVYALARAPSWTDEGTLWDLPDESSAPARMFAAAYPGRDGRDVILAQGESFNRYFATVFGQVQDFDTKMPWLYESENGFKVLHQNDKDTALWWTEVALKSAGFEPKATRTGYILMSPARTFMVLAVNGPVGDQDLHDLVDNLIPADEYTGDTTAP
jgi:hypothetical protein